MHLARLLFLGSLCTATFVSAQTPANLVTDGLPPLTPELRRDVSRYLEFRGAGFNGWHPVKREMLIATRFANTPQLHYVKFPGGERKQLTFLPEPALRGMIRPKTGDCFVFGQDIGGGEFFQLYRYDLSDGRITLLTDGKSRNTEVCWSKDGRQIAFTSTRRNGKDNDLYLLDPMRPQQARLLLQVEGGGWGISDWSEDGSRLLVSEYVSINESYLYLVNTATGQRDAITPHGATKIAYGSARFAKDGQSIFVTTDQDSEFQRLVRIDLATKQRQVLTAHIPWDVEEFELSPDGKLIAFTANENGISKLHLLDTGTGKERPAPALPLGLVANLAWHPNGRDLGFNLTSARSPYDVYSADVTTGKVERWTESETGGIDPGNFSEPELVQLKSFDGLPISAFVYRPDPKKFPGKRPVVINIHGGPEGQSQPGFQSRYNYYLNELGIAIVYPNVRGSAGYGKTFLTLDNGFKREDSVKDIGTVIDWIAQDAGMDSKRIAVMGGSYGGYMTLATLVHYSDRLRCGVDIVGISNFVTFLEHTQDYRRDLRRVEYGDERDPKMREFLQKISPNNNVERIRVPLFVVQGANDPRVPLSEAEQMVKAIKDHGGKVWYLMAKDEGHGFAKKANSDFQFLATIQFFKEHLLP